MEKLEIINAKKEKESFSAEKIYRACLNTGASESVSRKIAKEIKNRSYNEITTEEIGKLVQELLHEESEKVAIKFCLKKAMRDLGPNGFDFEKFIAAILKEDGFEVEINQIMPGYCVASYEIDFVSKKNKKRMLGECKYRSDPGKKIDLKVALYNHARFLDICKNPLFKNINIESIIVTNAKFTEKTIQYCNCNNMKLLGWKYPENEGLEKLVENFNLYPTTILPSFTKEFKNVFAQENIMLVKDLLTTTPQSISKLTGVSINKVNELIREANVLLE